MKFRKHLVSNMQKVKSLIWLQYNKSLEACIIYRYCILTLMKAMSTETVGKKNTQKYVNV